VESGLSCCPETSVREPGDLTRTMNMRQGMFLVTSSVNVHVQGIPQLILSGRPFVCLQLDLSILTGRTKGDVARDFTNVTVHGDSVVDYIIVSKVIRAACKSLHVTHNALSSHMCIKLVIVCS